MAKAAASAPEDKVELYEKLIASVPGVARRGATIPYTSVNGNMFSYLSKEGKLALRLPAQTRDAFLQKYKASLCSAYGVIQKEYVEVPAALMKKTSELRVYLAASFAYASSLKRKPTAAKTRK